MPKLVIEEPHSLPRPEAMKRLRAAADRAAARHGMAVEQPSEYELITGAFGQITGASAALSSEAVRFKSLTILGLSVYAVPSDVLAEHYRRLVGYAIAGDIQLEVEQVPLDNISDAWRRQAAGPGAKLVVVP